MSMQSTTTKKQKVINKNDASS